MAVVKSGIPNRYINQMMEVVEEFLRTTNTAETQQLIQGLDSALKPYKGHFLTKAQQDAQDNAIIDVKRNYLKTYFPQLQGVMFPMQSNGSIPTSPIRDTGAINTVLKQALNKLPKSTENTSTFLETKANPATLNETKNSTVADKPKSIKPTLKDKINALNKTKSSPAMASLSKEQAHLGYILKEISSLPSNDSKQTIIDTCFKDLGKYLQKGKENDTAAYIIKQTQVLLENLPQQKPAEANKTTAKVAPPKQVSASTTRATEVIKKPSLQKPTPKKAELSPIENATLTQISKAIACLSKYKDHLTKELTTNPNDNDLNTKMLAVENLMGQLNDSLKNGDKNKAVKSVTQYESDITFSRNPVLRLFGLKVAAWGTTGDKCIKNIASTLKEPSSPQIQTSFRPG